MSFDGFPLRYGNRLMKGTWPTKGVYAERDYHEVGDGPNEWIVECYGPRERHWHPMFSRALRLAGAFQLRAKWQEEHPFDTWRLRNTRTGQVIV